jgi:uncharacterized protein YfbU (UPF0304 family)
MSNEITDGLFKRLVLANQYTILTHLDLENADHWENAVRKAVEGWPVEDLPYVEEVRSYLRNALTREDQHFVLDSLNVFELIQDGLKLGFQPANEDAITKFPGFDGNREGKLMAYARYAVQDEKRFESVERMSHDFNSHMPMAEMYQRMIRVWEQQGRPLQINPDLFQSLIDAQPYPANR